MCENTNMTVSNFSTVTLVFIFYTNDILHCELVWPLFGKLYFDLLITFFNLFNDTNGTSYAMTLFFLQKFRENVYDFQLKNLVQK